MRFSGALLAAAFSGLAAAAPTQACSLASGYRVPTNLELVDRADAIVLARVEDGGPWVMPNYTPDPSDPPLIKARLVPVAVLKGKALPGEIRFDDAILANAKIKATASDPRNLVDANPDAFFGGCNRYFFDKGMMLVVFLRREGNQMVADGAPFARTLEDVPSADALWVKTVKVYVKIAAFPRQARRKEMTHQRDMLASEIEDADSRLLALELTRALGEKRD